MLDMLQEHDVALFQVMFKGITSPLVDEMKLFFHQTLVTMSDTYLRATQDEKMTATMKDFCDYFAEKLDLIKK